jgi:hypothetical protein
MNYELKTALKQEIEYVFGRQVLTARDCIELCGEIFNKTEKQLNPNTLRRFFGLVKADHPPSKSTLAILSRYCGYHSTEELGTVNKNLTGMESIEHDSLHYYFVSLFRELPVEDIHDKTFLNLVKHTIEFLNRNAVMTDKFQSSIAKTRNGQKFYFEYFINIDKLNCYYDSGLRYYFNEMKTPEARVFTHSLMVFKNWLNDSTDKVQFHAEELLSKISLTKLNASVLGLYYAALLYNAQVSGASITDILIDIYSFHSSCAKSKNEELVHFEYVISEALVLTGHFQHALYFIEQSDSRGAMNDQAGIRVSVQNFKLLKAICQFKSNELKEAEKIFDEIRPSEFYFLSKRFAGILYLHLAGELKRKNIKYNHSLNTLIRETGFIRLADAI